jgi:hypothetical protein
VKFVNAERHHTYILHAEFPLNRPVYLEITIEIYLLPEAKYVLHCAHSHYSYVRQLFHKEFHKNPDKLFKSLTLGHRRTDGRTERGLHIRRSFLFPKESLKRTTTLR